MLSDLKGDEMDFDVNDAGSGWIKLDLLSRGIEIDNSVSTFLRSSTRIALRKNFYNTPV